LQSRVPVLVPETRMNEHKHARWTVHDLNNSKLLEFSSAHSARVPGGCCG